MYEACLRMKILLVAGALFLPECNVDSGVLGVEPVTQGLDPSKYEATRDTHNPKSRVPAYVTGRFGSCGNTSIADFELVNVLTGVPKFKARSLGIDTLIPESYHTPEAPPAVL
jgi:hypothetical protein